MRYDMRKRKSTSVFTIAAIVTAVLIVIKASGAALATWSWWLIFSPVLITMGVFFLFTLGVGAIVGVRTGVDKVADEVFDEDDYPPQYIVPPEGSKLTPEQADALRKMLDNYGGGK
jgi:hypothetical protein